MSLKRSSHLLPSSTQIRDFFRISKHMNHPKFEDKFAKAPQKFEMTNALINHMIDLRVWAIAYAPTTNNILSRH